MSNENTGLFSRILSDYTYGGKPENQGERIKYRDIETCAPNCNRNDGGPPYAQFLKPKVKY